jgi:hypothetical protein
VVEAAKTAGSDFRPHEDDRVERGDGVHAPAVAARLRAEPRPLVTGRE